MSFRLEDSFDSFMQQHFDLPGQFLTVARRKRKKGGSGKRKQVKQSKRCKRPSFKRIHSIESDNIFHKSNHNFDTHGEIEMKKKETKKKGKKRDKRGSKKNLEKPFIGWRESLPKTEVN